MEVKTRLTFIAWTATVGLPSPPLRWTHRRATWTWFALRVSGCKTLPPGPFGLCLGRPRMRFIL